MSTSPVRPGDLDTARVGAYFQCGGQFFAPRAAPSCGEPRRRSFRPETGVAARHAQDEGKLRACFLLRPAPSMCTLYPANLAQEGDEVLGRDGILSQSKGFARGREPARVYVARDAVGRAAPSRSSERSPPGALHFVRLIWSGPRRHSHAYDRQWFVSEGAKLELRAPPAATGRDPDVE